MLETINYKFKKPELMDSPPDITVMNPNWDKIDAELKKNADSAKAAQTYETAGGTGTAITISAFELINGISRTFIASATNGGAPTTLNGKPVYKPNTTFAPNIVAGKAYTVWYSSTGNCFFLKASAEGDAVAVDVLAGKTFSNDNDTAIVGTMSNNGEQSATLALQNQIKTIPEGYTSGGEVRASFSNLMAENVRSGVNIGGVVGILKEVSLPITTQMKFSSSLSSLNFTGIEEKRIGQEITTSNLFTIYNPSTTKSIYIKTLDYPCLRKRGSDNWVLFTVGVTSTIPPNTLYIVYNPYSSIIEITDDSTTIDMTFKYYIDN